MTTACRIGASLLLLSACAPVTQGGPPVDLPAGLARTSSIGMIQLSAAPVASGLLAGNPRAQSEVDAGEPFVDTFTDDLREGLAQCADGPVPLRLRVHLYDDIRREAASGRAHGGAGLAELVDPATGQVVGRYDIQFDVPPPRQGWFADPGPRAGHAFAEALCRRAFPR